MARNKEYYCFKIIYQYNVSQKVKSQNAPDCISACIHFKKLPGGMPPDPTRNLVAFGLSGLLPQTINPRQNPERSTISGTFTHVTKKDEQLPGHSLVSPNRRHIILDRTLKDEQFPGHSLVSPNWKHIILDRTVKDEQYPGHSLVSPNSI